MGPFLRARNMQLACRLPSDRFYLLVPRAVLRCPLKFARKLKSLVKQLDNLQYEFQQEFLRASIRRSINKPE